MTRAAALKEKAAMAFKRRNKAKLDAWILTEGPHAKSRVAGGLPSSPEIVTPEVQAGAVSEPPGQGVELRAPVGVRGKEIEAAWALVARASPASRSASASASRAVSRGSSSSRTASGVASKSGSGSRST